MSVYQLMKLSLRFMTNDEITLNDDEKIKLNKVLALTSHWMVFDPFAFDF